MHLSLNEIEVNLRKAALGAGLPYGLADDAGRAGAWLASCGLPGIADCLAAMEQMESEDTRSLEFAEGRDVLRIQSPASALLLGPAMADRLRLAGAGMGSFRIEAECVDSPLLCLAALAVAFEDCEHPFTLAWGASTAPPVNACGNGGGVQLCRDTPCGPGDIFAVLGDGASVETQATGPNLEVLRRENLETGVAVDKETWDRVNHLAARILVPATEFSRLAGAGAGTSDND